MRLARIILPAAAAAMIVAGGCNTSGCLENRNSIPLAGFYSYGTGDAIAIDSLAVGGIGAPGDSLLLAPGRASQQVYLPLRSSATETAFFIAYEQRDLRSTPPDTITLTYSSEPRFVSEDCGAMYYYRLRRVGHTRHLIDSVGVADSLITNTDIERLRIYFRTAEPDETPDLQAQK